MSETTFEDTISSDYGTWLDRLCEAMHSSFGEVEESFENRAKLRSLVDRLQMDNSWIEPSRLLQGDTDQPQKIKH